MLHEQRSPRPVPHTSPSVTTRRKKYRIIPVSGTCQPCSSACFFPTPEPRSQRHTCVVCQQGETRRHSSQNWCTTPSGDPGGATDTTLRSSQVPTSHKSATSPCVRTYLQNINPPPPTLLQRQNEQNKTNVTQAPQKMFLNRTHTWTRLLPRNPSVARR